MQDGSGQLDRDEVRSLVEMVGTTFSDAELDAAMAELDPSGDGQVDFPEFKAYWVRAKHCCDVPRHRFGRECGSVAPCVVDPEHGCARTPCPG